MMNGQAVASRVGSREEWLEARMEHLAKEKELTRLRDELARERRALPWVRVEKDYRFETRAGRLGLGDLFEGRSQLIVYHFMFGPEWEEGCTGCSFLADHFDGALPHINERDVTVVAASRAPLAKLEAFKRRMGWRFPWVSTMGDTFNRDHGVLFTATETENGGAVYNYERMKPPMEDLHGLSVFIKDEAGAIYHTYSTYARGCEVLLGAYAWLDLTPKGRDEDGLEQPMAWVRHHDKYEGRPAGVAACGCCGG